MPNPYTLGAAGLVAVALLGGAGWLGYDYGATIVQQRWDEQRAAAEAEARDALATLATRFQDAEQRYAAERDRKRRVVEREVERVVYRNQAVPDRGCDLQPDVRGLYLDTICAHPRNASHPECLSRDVPGNAVPPAGGDPGAPGEALDDAGAS